MSTRYGLDAAMASAAADLAACEAAFEASRVRVLQSRREANDLRLLGVVGQLSDDAKTLFITGRATCSRDDACLLQREGLATRSTLNCLRAPGEGVSVYITDAGQRVAELDRRFPQC